MRVGSDADAHTRSLSGGPLGSASDRAQDAVRPAFGDPSAEGLRPGYGGGLLDGAALLCNQRFLLQQVGYASLYSTH